MADVSVRPAVAADAAAIAELQVAGWRDAYAELLPAGALDALTLEEARAQWVSAVTAPPSASHRVLVATEGGQVAGFAALGPATDPDLDAAGTGELLVLLVPPDRARSGHGSRLLAAAAEHLREQGRVLAVIWLLERDAVLRQFLEGAGWAADGATRDLDAGEPVPQLRLHTDLRAD